MDNNNLQEQLILEGSNKELEYKDNQNTHVDKENIENPLIVQDQLQLQNDQKSNQDFSNIVYHDQEQNHQSVDIQNQPLDLQYVIIKPIFMKGYQQYLYSCKAVSIYLTINILCALIFLFVCGNLKEFSIPESTQCVIVLLNITSIIYQMQMYNEFQAYQSLQKAAVELGYIQEGSLQENSEQSDIIQQQPQPQQQMPPQQQQGPKDTELLPQNLNDVALNQNGEANNLINNPNNLNEQQYEQQLNELQVQIEQNLNAINDRFIIETIEKQLISQASKHNPKIMISMITVVAMSQGLFIWLLALFCGNKAYNAIFQKSHVFTDYDVMIFYQFLILMQIFFQYIQYYFYVVIAIAVVLPFFLVYMIYIGIQKIVKKYKNQRFVTKIKKIQYKLGLVKNDPICAICMNDFQIGEDIVILKCPGKHAFHYNCAITWLQISTSCPTCRHEFK